MITSLSADFVHKAVYQNPMKRSMTFFFFFSRSPHVFFTASSRQWKPLQDSWAHFAFFLHFRPISPLHADVLGVFQPFPSFSPKSLFKRKNVGRREASAAGFGGSGSLCHKNAGRRGASAAGFGGSGSLYRRGEQCRPPQTYPPHPQTCPHTSICHPKPFGV